MRHYNRRNALAVVAAAPGAIAAYALPAFGEPGKLASLVGQYLAELDAFNSDLRADDDNWSLADMPFDSTLQRMIGVPVRGSDDAVAAIDWILNEGKETAIELGDGSYGRVAEWLLHALRDYHAGRVA